jgi:Glycosyl hydrolase family 12
MKFNRGRGFIAISIAAGGVVLSMTGVALTQVTKLPAVNLSPGQVQPLTCKGGRLVGKLSVVGCKATTTTAVTTTTSSATTTTGLRATTTTGKSGSNCTNPSATVPYNPGNAQSGAQEGHFYVTNDTWNASGYSVAQTLYACNYNSWYVVAKMNNNSGDGAVKTAPNVQLTSSNGTPINRYGSIRSSYDDVPPSNMKSSDIFEFDYDIWLQSLAQNPSTEIMIWTWNHGQTPGGSQVGTTTIGAVTYDVYRSAGSQQYIAFEAIPADQSLSGRLDISDFFNYAASRGWVASNVDLYQIDDGMELVSTSGQNEQFSINSFSLSAG